MQLKLPQVFYLPTFVTSLPSFLTSLLPSFPYSSSLFTLPSLVAPVSLAGLWILRRYLKQTDSPFSKLTGVHQWVRVDHKELVQFGIAVMRAIGCDDETAKEVSEHLVESNLQSVDSHGVVRLTQYTDQVRKGLLVAGGRPTERRTDGGAWLIDGNGGFGITALTVAIDKGLHLLKDPARGGVAAVGVINCGHTGRLGQFVEQAARKGALAILCGGGSRRCWPQVAPYGGAKGLLPTNPWAIAIPGDSSGPVVLDFATSAVAGGWVMTALASGADLPANVIIDKEGRPTRDPQKYKAGGALLPAGGPKGYGLALMAELIGGALLGKVAEEAGLGLNMLVLLVDTSAFISPEQLHKGVASILKEVRDCPPAPGHSSVLVPGQWELKEAEKRKTEGVPLPSGVWNGLKDLALQLKVEQELPSVTSS